MKFYLEEDGHQLEEPLRGQLLCAATFCAALEGLDPARCAVSLSFVEPEEIRRLNREYRENDSVTDVLSFPQFADLDELRAQPLGDEEEILLGDVVLCLEKAKQQAEEYGHSLEREIVYLFVHSIFHLLGYDHMNEADKAAMRAVEEEVMERMRLLRKDAPEQEDAAGANMHRLYAAALAAAEQSYSPYSHFPVGAALLGESGRVYTGCNVENACYNVGICAERCACLKAVSEGERKFRAIAVASPKGDAWPCGACRQFLAEFGTDLSVISGPDAAHLECHPLSELLPKTFTL